MTEIEEGLKSLLMKVKEESVSKLFPWKVVEMLEEMVVSWQKVR